MYEEIDLDAIESNKDEAPDYRPMLKSQSSGTPVSVEYRMRYLSTLESEEKASYQEFARIADQQGMRKIAKVFRDILQDEKGHADELAEKSSTVTNLKTAIQREKDKIGTIKSVMAEAEKENDSSVTARLSSMLAEEQGHVEKLGKALDELEKDIARMKSGRKEEENEEFCTYGVCVPKGKGELPNDVAPEVVE